MISNKDIKGLDFNTIEEYFSYIADSIVNGQRQQARELIKKASLQQRRDALNYFEFHIEECELLTELRSMLNAKFMGSSWLVLK